MVRQETRRRFLQASCVAATISLTGCSSPSDGDSTPTETGTVTTETVTTETPTEMGTQSVTYDFDESRASLTEAGWKIAQSVDITDSHLRGTVRENSQRDYAMYPSPASGTWTFGGVANDEQFYGVQFILSTADVETTDVDGDDLATAPGYSLLVRQKRFGGLVLKKRSADGDSGGSTNLHEEEFESSGNPNDYAISMLDSNRFRLSMNGTELATVTDDTYDINSLVVRFDGPQQRVDSVAYSP